MRATFSTRFWLFLLGLLPSLDAQPSGATVAAPALVGPPPSAVVFATDQPASGFWREHWFVRDLEHGNPPVSGRFRVNDAYAAFQKNFKDRNEVFANGLMQIPTETDVTTVRAAELYLEVWGGHVGTANKRFTVNGRSTYALPEDGTADDKCAHQYPSLPLRITDLIRGHNVVQFACDRGSSFWGHFIVDEACLRLELPRGQAELAKAGLADFAARVNVTVQGEKLELILVGEGAALAEVATVEFFGCYEGYDECGAGGGRQWHGFTRQKETLGHLGTAKTVPYRVTWDTSMLPAQRDVAVRAVVRFKQAADYIYRTPILEGLQITERPGATVARFGLQELPRRFWSRINQRKSAVIVLPVDPARIARAELHTTTWTGGPGEVKEYFKLNGRHFPVAEGSRHRTEYTVFPVEPQLLRRGDNLIEIVSDTEHHGIEILKPGPALVVRYREH